MISGPSSPAAMRASRSASSRSAASASAMPWATYSPSVMPVSDGGLWSCSITRVPAGFVTLPASGVSCPARMRSSVVLPSPLRPTTAKR